MIDFDYNLERDYGDEIKHFKPDKIPTTLPNLVYIEAPNSSGKSTLLNILALGFHGLKNDRMNIALKNKMSDLANSTHQKLTFKVNITNADGSLELASTKGTPEGDIMVRETIGGKTTLLTPDAFHRKYNLIYDIPDNPTERLNQLVNEIRDIQKMYGNRIGAFRNYLTSITNGIQQSRNPKRLEELKGLIEKGTTDLQKINEALEVDETFLNTIEKFSYAKMLEKTSSDLVDIYDQIGKLEVKIQKDQGKIKRVNKRFQNQLVKTKSFLSEMKDCKQQIASLIEPYLLKEDKHHIDLWSRIDLDAALEDYVVPSSLDSEILALKRVLLGQYDPGQDVKDLTEAKVYSDLIEFLNNYRNSDVTLPGDKTIDEFIAQLEESSKQYRDLKIKAENHAKVNRLLDQLRDNIREANEMLSALYKLKRESSPGEEEVMDEEDEKELEELNRKRAIVEQSLDYPRQECAKRGVYEKNLDEVLDDLESIEALAPYRVYDNTQLQGAIDDMRSRVFALQREKKNKTEAVRLYRNELARQEKLEPHKYQGHLQDLHMLVNRVMRLEQKLSVDFDNKIISVIDKRVDKKAENDEYYEEVAKYLGRRVGYVRHLDESFKVSKIDLIRGNIITTSGKTIRLTDMGTGQSQSAYLISLLNTDDKRKIIAIFDEVAMMDKLSLEPIYNKFRELYEQDRLLVGIVVQKGDSTNIVSKLEA